MEELNIKIESLDLEFRVGISSEPIADSDIVIINPTLDFCERLYNSYLQFCGLFANFSDENKKAIFSEIVKVL